ncbi:GIY-YIG nuclease family protein [Candidatus Microgenomates bacterium]|nr:GIY-YIG nuclease family protein [Candidatus Microgenomates bacterium]
MGWVYILRLSNGKYYVGSTSNLLQRLETHKNGKSKYTSKHLPLELVFSQKCPDILIAKKIEIWLKDLKSRRIIEQIILDGKITRSF